MNATSKGRNTVTASVLALVLVVVIYFIESVLATGLVNANSTPTVADPRSNYFPNTEVLGSDEMRVISLGTGSPNFRRSQASASWLVELGNGEKFIFDIGTGSLANLGALEIPYSYLDKIFISHLHVDHIGDLDAMFVGGWVSNRTGPLRVWGPGGLTPELGTKYAVDKLQDTRRTT